MNSEIYLSNHFKQRGKERVSKSLAKVKKLAYEAYYYGDSYQVADDERVSLLLEEAEIFGRICKIYRGFVYWFTGNVAITVYPISSKKVKL